MLAVVLSASPRDVPAIGEVERKLFPQSFSERQLLAELREGHGLIVHNNGCVVGYCLLRGDHNLVEITRLAVTEPFRRAGLGTALLEAAKQYAGDRTLFLQVEKSNAGALKLYRRSGFDITGECGNTWAMLCNAPQSPPTHYLHHPQVEYVT